ncbi:protein FAR1-RELATED SEQUENCE 5-like [Helianthus annuus]|uniref:protein FAR1-RELATED SEQUENCE 5-like n=1 Tax=Helianthus annuus TaxID=4232 RepID=UPI0016532760|nr:protein FAR1-RELATED SEQUENCE 5-like [Helianthus annuus]
MMSTTVDGVRICPTTGNQYYTPVVPDSSKPVVGMHFQSIDSAFNFYKKYAKLSGFEGRKHTQSSKNGVVIRKYFVCAKEGSATSCAVDTVNDSVGADKKLNDRRRRPSKRTGCKAHIRLSLTPKNTYRISHVFEEHNHSFVDEEDYHLLASSRKLTFTEEQLLSDFSEMNIGPVRAFNLMRKIRGGFDKVGVTSTDCKNFKRDINLFIGEFDVDMAVQRLMKKKLYLPNFSCEFYCDEKGALAGLFWADEEMKLNYEVFGDVMSFDATFRTNRYDLVFVPFTGIDNHHHNVTFAGSLLASETAESYKWLLQSFLKAFGVAPKVVVTDQDAAMKIAIRDVFPDTRHRLCMWHIMIKVSERVGTELSQDEVFKEDICDVVWTDALEPAQFETQWCDLMIKYNLTSNSWLSDMYNLRSDWIPAYYRHEHMSGLMRTTSRSESENHFFGQLTNTKLSLVEFLSHFDTAMESQRFKRSKRDHDTRYTQPRMKTNYELELEAAKIYTRGIFFDVQEEIRLACKNCMCRREEEVGDSIKFYILQVNLPGLHEVLFTPKDMVIKCSCNRYEQYGLLCRHAFCVLRLCGIKEFPKKYVMGRWTRDVVPKKTKVSSFDQNAAGNQVERASSIVREIMTATEHIVNRLVTNIDMLSLYRDQVIESKLKVDSADLPAESLDKNARLANILHADQPCSSSSATILPPSGIRNKGCGSNKRLKSFREVSSSRISKKTKTRGCLICGGHGHNSRTCKMKTTIADSQKSS